MYRCCRRARAPATLVRELMNKRHERLFASGFNSKQSCDHYMVPKPDGFPNQASLCVNMEWLKPPEGLSLSGNVADNWERFIQRVELYFEATATGTTVRTDKQKVALLLRVAGPEAVDVFNTFTLTEDQKQNYAEVIHKFQEYCAPKANETFERHVFRKTHQAEGQSFEQFLRELKLKVRSCNFGVLTDSLVRDQIVDGIRDDKLRERLLREDDLTLERSLQSRREVFRTSQDVAESAPHSGRAGRCYAQDKQEHTANEMSKVQQISPTTPMPSFW